MKKLFSVLLTAAFLLSSPAYAVEFEAYSGDNASADTTSTSVETFGELSGDDEAVLYSYRRSDVAAFDADAAPYDAVPSDGTPYDTDAYLYGRILEDTAPAAEASAESETDSAQASEEGTVEEEQLYYASGEH
ncbi:MAG: hypothetical protein IJQ81_06475, partial [Oscillibacter sp.]|nr:hypothetical protein [Oscillibacter sp.]